MILLTLLQPTPEPAPIKYEPRLIALRAIPTIVVEEAVWEKPLSYKTDCVTTLKLTGDLPWRSVSPTNWAKDIPIRPLELAEGGTAIISTREGDKGHILKVKMIQGNLVSIVEGGHLIGVGRIVDPQLVKGEVSL